MEATHWVIDWETISNCAILVVEDVKTETSFTFKMTRYHNDIEKLLFFLDRNVELKEWHVSFNGLAFDSQVTQNIMNNREHLLGLENGEEVAKAIYKIAQHVIDYNRTNNWPEFPLWKLSIGQLDIFKMNHWDNPAKSSSLKWIQYSMDWYNIKDMPIEHTEEIVSLEQIDEIVKYCINDVKSTKKILNLSKSLVNLRKDLTEEYNINLYSASEPRIAKSLFLHFLEEKTGIPKNEIRNLRTIRDSIKVENILLDYFNFKTKPFKILHDKFKSLTIDPLNIKGAFKYVMRYKGTSIEFGFGGVHGAKDNGVYESDKDHVIMSSDVVSFYPNLAIRNKWSPAHLPKEEFCDQYEWFFNERRKISKKDKRNYVYKIILNSTYGLSNDKNSFLYDPDMTMRITMNGQLSLMLLCEMITENIPNAVPLIQNTDGLETIIPREYVDKYYEICKEWEKITQLELEHDTYSKIVLANVNNYIGVFDYKEVSKEDYEDKQSNNELGLFKIENDKYYFAPVKCKGMMFEFDKLALHKNKSHLIIRKALYNYFVNGDKDVEKFIKSSTNIFDFCAGIKSKNGWKFKTYGLSDDKYTMVKKAEQKTIRYYITNKNGVKIKKEHPDGRSIFTEAGIWMQKIFNEYVELPMEEYHIDYRYYINETYKVIDMIEKTGETLELF